MYATQTRKYLKSLKDHCMLHNFDARGKRYTRGNSEIRIIHLVADPQ